MTSYKIAFDTVNGRRIIGDVQSIRMLEDGSWELAIQPYAIFTEILHGGAFRRKRKALARSRRNNGTVKRHSHGRAQRTRRSR